MSCKSNVNKVPLSMDDDISDPFRDDSSVEEDAPQLSWSNCSDFPRCDLGKHDGLHHYNYDSREVFSGSYFEGEIPNMSVEEGEEVNKPDYKEGEKVEKPVEETVPKPDTYTDVEALFGGESILGSQK